MKTAFSLLALIVTAGLAHAGGFGGPPPFTNGSPLLTGVDGSYQATVRGENVSGVIRFSYSSGIQTTTVAGNFYTIFVDGQVYFGEVQANINYGKIGGTLDNSFAVNGNTGSGYFNGTIDEDAADAAFSGKGSISVVNGTTTLEVVADTVTVNGSTTTTTTETTETTTPEVVIQRSFQFSGVRNSQSSS